MKIESARRNSLKIGVLCVVASVLPTASIALPKGNGPHSCLCMCDVVLGGQQTFVPTTFSLSAQFSCSSAGGAVCNVSDPATGGVRQGALSMCADNNLHGTVPKSQFGPKVTHPFGNALSR
jgi:hypothetical protein